MSDKERKAFAQNMVTVADYLAKDPGWLDTDVPAQNEGVAEALGPIGDLKKRLAQRPGQVGAEFQAGALREGTAAFERLVRAVAAAMTRLMEQRKGSNREDA